MAGDIWGDKNYVLRLATAPRSQPDGQGFRRSCGPLQRQVAALWDFHSHSFHSCHLASVYYQSYAELTNAWLLKTREKTPSYALATSSRMGDTEVGCDFGIHTEKRASSDGPIASGELIGTLGSCLRVSRVSANMSITFNFTEHR